MDYIYSFFGFFATVARMKNGARQDVCPGAPRWRAVQAYFAVTVTGTVSCAVKPLLSSATSFSV